MFADENAELHVPLKYSRMTLGRYDYVPCLTTNSATTVVFTAGVVSCLCFIEDELTMKR